MLLQTGACKSDNFLLDFEFKTFADAYLKIEKIYTCLDHGEELRALCTTDTEYYEFLADLDSIQQSANETAAEIFGGPSCSVESGIRISSRITQRRLFGNVDRSGRKVFVSEPPSSSDIENQPPTKQRRLYESTNSEIDEGEADDELDRMSV